MAMIAPTVDSVGDAALTDSIIDKSITELQDDIVTALKAPALYGCTALKKVAFGSVTSVAANVFQNCTALEVADFHQAVAIKSGAFTGCTALAALILRSTEKCTITSSAGLGSTGISAGTGYIYVPSALVETYKAAEGWSTYAGQIRAIEDYPEVCSTTGKVWAHSNITSGIYIHAAYGGGVWVAAQGATIKATTDVKNWPSSYATGVAGTINKLVFANGLFFAATGKGVYWSEDGTKWTQGVSDAGVNVCYANGLFVAGTSGSGLYYSEDGKTWTQSNITSGKYEAVCYGNGVWVSCGSSGAGYCSEDGKTWTQNNLESNTRAIAFEGGLFVACKSSGLYYSEDGITWTQSNVTSDDFAGGAAYNGNVWVAAGNTPYYSEDGKTWTQSGVGTIYCRELELGGGMFVIGSGKGVYYSADGKTWSQSNLTSGEHKGVAYGDGVWVAASATGIYYSE